ncbi:MAG: ABC transporter substrate-binding protein, partial [Rhizobiaceae bacterium]|nr:ABC transporter substrate-binding protein [Rhizobiaceae bacterium]
VSPDGQSITFKLRSGVVFHDGTVFDAAAVKYNFDRVIDPSVKAFAHIFVENLTSTEVVDPQTVKVNFKGASGALLAALTGPAGMIVSPTAAKAEGDKFTDHPVGTGPFEFVNWAPADHVEVKRFDKYWKHDATGQPLPYLDGVLTRDITNSAVKLVELRSGNVQLGDIVQEKDYDTIKRDPNLELLQNPVGISQYLSFPVEKAPWTDVKLREAITDAINPAVLSKVTTGGAGTLLATFETPASWAFDSSLKPHTYDPKKAAELYKESGHQGPINMIIGNRDVDIKIAQVIQSELAAIGIKMTIEVLERQAFFDKGINQKYDLMLQRTAMPLPDPDMLYSSAYGANASVNYAGIKDPDIVKAVEDARAAKDQPTRKQLYSKIQGILLDKYYQVFFFWRPNQGVRRKRLNDVELDYMGDWRLDHASFSGEPPK